MTVSGGVDLLPVKGIAISATGTWAVARSKATNIAFFQLTGTPNTWSNTQVLTNPAGTTVAAQLWQQTTGVAMSGDATVALMVADTTNTFVFVRNTNTWSYLETRQAFGQPGDWKHWYSVRIDGNKFLSQLGAAKNLLEFV